MAEHGVGDSMQGRGGVKETGEQAGRGQVERAHAQRVANYNLTQTPLLRFHSRSVYLGLILTL